MKQIKSRFIHALSLWSIRNIFQIIPALSIYFLICLDWFTSCYD